jgi:EAL domain-containing protein (putative c-di-GMP-specific phosphodiesterase class I)
MYRAKQRGRSRYEVFDGSARAETLARVAIERDLHRAVDAGELEVHFQPVVCVGTGRPVGMEALVRWVHPDRGTLEPGTFLAVAEETGLVVPIGRAVLETATRQAATWQARLDPELHVSVNVSARQLAHPDFVETVVEAVRSSGIAPGTLWLEITEEVLLEDLARTRDVLRELAELNVRACIDDFGAGYSSLRYLRSLPARLVKIDRSFAAGLGHRRPDEAIVAAVVQMAEALDVKVVLEGVESPAQLAAARRLGVPLAQGHLFARPMPPPAATAYLAARLGPPATPAPTRGLAPH